MTKLTPREKIHELIKQNYNENTARCVVALVMPVIDTLLEEARQEMKEKCLAFITNPDEMVNEQYRFASKQDYAEHIRNSISSL